MPAENPPANQWSLPGQPPPRQQPPAPLPGQYPPQPRQGGFGPEGTIVLTLQGNVLTSNMLTPQVQIDGHPVPASYGANYLPVPAGRHTVSAHATWIVKYGQAWYDVEVPPGQVVPVFYATPFVQFVKGRMGPAEQRRPGLGALALTILVIILIVVGLGAATG